MGKSTLLRIIAGKDSADTGSVISRNDISIGILDQDPELNPENYVFEEVFNSENPTLKLIKTYEQAVKDNDASALEELIPANGRSRRVGLRHASETNLVGTQGRQVQPAD